MALDLVFFQQCEGHRNGPFHAAHAHEVRTEADGPRPRNRVQGNRGNINIINLDRRNASDCDAVKYNHLCHPLRCNCLYDLPC